MIAFRIFNLVFGCGFCSFVCVCVHECLHAFRICVYGTDTRWHFPRMQLFSVGCQLETATIDVYAFTHSRSFYSVLVSLFCSRNYTFTNNSCLHVTCIAIAVGSLSLSLCSKHAEDKMSINEQHTDFQAKWNRQWHSHHPFLPSTPLPSCVVRWWAKASWHATNSSTHARFPLCIDRLLHNGTQWGNASIILICSLLIWNYFVLSCLQRVRLRGGEQERRTEKKQRKSAGFWLDSNTLNIRCDSFLTRSLAKIVFRIIGMCVCLFVLVIDLFIF